MSLKNNAVLTITIMTRGCESKQAHSPKQANSRCQSYQQNRIIFGNDYTPIVALNNFVQLYLIQHYFLKLLYSDYPKYIKFKDPKII
jgi:hypothetical protein